MLLGVEEEEEEEEEEENTENLKHASDADERLDSDMTEAEE